MQLHIICPFYRKEILKTQKHYLEPMNIQWYPVCNPVELQAFEDNDKDWIHPILCRDFRPEEVIAYAKINEFIDKHEIIDEDYYGCMGDDDMYEPGFFDVIRQQTAKIVFFSLSRGNATPWTEHPAGRHPFYPLIISGMGDVRVGNIGLIQFMVKGEILKQMRFNTSTPSDDGSFIVELGRRFPNEVKFMPDLFAYGNFFQPGRYTDDQWKLKPHWELPKVID